VKLYQFWCSSACHALYVQKNLIFHETCAFWINKPKKLNLCFYQFPFHYNFLHWSLSVTVNWSCQEIKEGPTRMVALGLVVATLHMTCQFQYTVMSREWISFMGKDKSTVFLLHWALCTWHSRLCRKEKWTSYLKRRWNVISTRATLECVFLRILNSVGMHFIWECKSSL
jgi:hypothetical protein